MTPYLTPSQVADDLQVSERTVYEWLRTDQLSGAKLGQQWRVDARDLSAFVDRSRAERMLNRVKKEHPEHTWERGRCTECDRAIPVPADGRSWLCGEECRADYRAKLHHLIDANSEEDAITRHPRVVPYWT